MIPTKPEEVINAEYISAVNTFNETSFEYSIFHSVRASELAIAFKLDSILEPIEKDALHKENPRGLHLSKLIKISEKKLLIPTKLAEEALILNDFRNMSVHPSNFVALTISVINNWDIIGKEFVSTNRLTKIMEKLPPKTLKKIIANKSKLEPRKTMLQNTIDKVSIPSLEWTSSIEGFKRQNNHFKNRLNVFFNSDIFIKNIIPYLEQLNEKNSESNLQDNLKFDFAEDIAKQALNITKRILQTLSYL
ncbi:hypothetical protein ACFL96_07835 [Thermoproteota archaeon]